MLSLNSNISLTLPKITVVKGPRSQREEMIEKFRARINEGRAGTKYRPLSHVAVKLKLQHVESEHELYAFYKDCEGAKSFSAYFFYALNPARHD